MMKMSGHSKKNSFFALLIGLFSKFGKTKIRPTVEDLKRADFNTSTQRLGVRFTERIRNIFRFKWLIRKRHL